MANPNINAATTFTFGGASGAVASSGGTIVANASGSNAVIKITQLSISQQANQAAAKATALIQRASTSTIIGGSISCAAEGLVEIVNAQAPRILMENDCLRVTGATTLNYDASYETYTT